MSAEPVDKALDQGRAGPCPGPRHRLLGHVVGRHRVAAVESDAGEAVAGRPLRGVLDRVLLAVGSRDREAVVLDDEDFGQLVDRREVHRLMGVATPICAASCPDPESTNGARPWRLSTWPRTSIWRPRSIQ